jgi:hypothetical protein
MVTLVWRVAIGSVSVILGLSSICGTRWKLPNRILPIWVSCARHIKGWGQPTSALKQISSCPPPTSLRTASALLLSCPTTILTNTWLSCCRRPTHHPTLHIRDRRQLVEYVATFSLHLHLLMLYRSANKSSRSIHSERVPTDTLKRGVSIGQPPCPS